MGRISVELVPREKDTFIKEIRLIKENFSSIDTINIPDILRYEIRSLEGCALVNSFFLHKIPHLRAAAINKIEPLPFRDFFKENNINEVLVVLGDRLGEESAGFVSCTSVELIKKFKKEMAQVKVYAAIDQYRSDFKTEYEYVQEKIDAGAQGFFTQPFFDLKYMEVYAKELKNVEVFWGVSPVTTDRSKCYWEKNNKVVFPEDFKPELDWNKKFALSVSDFIKAAACCHIYFMPIKTDIIEYLTGVI